MQIIRRKSDHVVLYMFDDVADVQITETGMTGPVNAMDILPETHELLTDIPAPAKFWGGLLSWNGSWTVLDQSALDQATAPPPEPVPHEITNWQAKKQLIIDGVYDRVVDAISTMDVDAQVDWNHAAVFRRDYPLILQMQTLLGRTDADTDAYFMAASKLS